MHLIDYIHKTQIEENRLLSTEKWNSLLDARGYHKVKLQLRLYGYSPLIHTWLNETVGSKHVCQFGVETYWFEYEEDAILFKLKFDRT